MFGYVIGQTALADAYTIGNETPNIVYELLIGGVLSATLVPLFTSFLERDDDESTNVVITVALVVLAALTAVAVLAAPLIFGLYTLDPAAGVDADEFRQVGTLLTRVFLLQIFFYGATALANAILNSRRRFFAAAWSPILRQRDHHRHAAVAARRRRRGRGRSATCSTTTGCAGRSASAPRPASPRWPLVLSPPCAAPGLRFRPDLRFRHPAVRRLLVLSGWTLGYVVANQVTIVVVRNLADPGFGRRPRLLRGVHVLRPPPRPARRVDRHHVRPRDGALGHPPATARRSATRRRSASGLIALLTLPAGVLLFVLRRAIVGALLQHGEYTAANADNAARALGGFALGLVGFSLYLFVLRGFYAHQDTRTPFVINVVQNVLNIVLAVALVGRYDILGLGAALAISYVVCAAVGAAGADVQGARVPAARRVRQPVADGRSPASSPAR